MYNQFCTMVYLPFGHDYLSWNKMRCLHLNLCNPIFCPSALSKNRVFYIFPRINMPNFTCFFGIIIFDNCYQNIKHGNKNWMLYTKKQKEITIIDTNFSYFSIEVKLEEIGCLRENWPLSLQFFQRE